MGLLDFLQDAVETVDDILSMGQKPAYKETDEDKADKAWYGIRSRYSVSCHKCGKLAYPVRYTDRHYECTCGNKFTGARHPDGDYSDVTW